MKENTALTNEAMLDQLFNAMNNPVELDRLLSDEVSLKNEITDSPTEDTTPVEEQDAPPETTDTTDIAPPPEDDWRAKLPEDLRDRVVSEFNAIEQQRQALEHYRSSNEGRVSGLQKKISQLESQLTSVKQPATLPPKPEPAAVKPEVNQVEEDLKRDDPALYNVLQDYKAKIAAEARAAVAEVRQEFDSKFQQTITPLQQRAAQSEAAEQAELVKQAIPNVEQIVTSEYWEQFMSTASDSTRALANSARADDFLTAMDVFTMWAHRNYGHLGKAEQAAPATQPAAAPNPQARAIVDTRARKANAVAPASRVAPAAPIREEDEAQLLEKMFQEIRSQDRV